MRGERPVPLWPEGLRKGLILPPVENPRRQVEALGKSPPAGSRQEIEAIAPSYLDDRARFVFSLRLNPDRKPGTDPGDRLPEYHGWDGLAEVMVDFSGFVPKPDNPSIPYEDIEGRIRNDRIANNSSARRWEDHTVRCLEETGRADLIPQFKQNMQEYQKAVKAVVAVWRKRGLL
jgi:hypothetical protein